MNFWIEEASTALTSIAGVRISTIGQSFIDTEARQADSQMRATIRSAKASF